MFDKNYFLNQLRNGESLDVMAQSIADTMNEAMEAYQAEQVAARKAENEAHINQRKFEITQAIVELIQEYGALIMPEIDDTFTYTEADLKLMMKSLDEMFGLMKSMVQLKANLECGTATKEPVTDDEILANFITSLV